LICTISINAQIILSDNDTLCTVQPLTLSAVSTTLDSLNVDDTYTGVQNIGFNFIFYGNTYNSLLISSNGYVTFDTTDANGYSPWAIGSPIPNPGNPPENAIMTPWHDTDPSVSGIVYYGSFGIAPNRVYIVTWCNLAMFSCNSMFATSQLFLYEGSNKIEMYIQDKPLCLTWNTGQAIQGLVDATSTNFDIVDDPVLLLPRNAPLTWTATNEGWEFLPNGPTSYTINQIPFQPPATGQTTWKDFAGNILGVGPYLSINPTTTTTYYAEMPITCSGNALYDSVTIVIDTDLDINVNSINTSCLGNDGQLVVEPVLSTTQPPWNIELLDNAGNLLQSVNVTTLNYTFSNLFPGTYIVRVFDGLGCSTQKTVTVLQTGVSYSVSTNIEHVSCYGYTDGRLAVHMNGSPIASYSIYLDGVLNTNPVDSVFLNVSPGYHVLTVVDDNSCMVRDTIFVKMPSSPLQVIASTKATLCHQDSLGQLIAVGAGGTPVYSYEWFNSLAGPNSQVLSTDDTITNLPSGIYFVRIIDANGCDTSAVAQIISPQTALFSTHEVSPVICKGDSSGYIVGDAGGGYPPYIYTWTTSLNGDTISQSFAVSNTDTIFNLPASNIAGAYLLDIVDQRGCTSTQSSILINEPLSPLSIDTLMLVDSIDCYGDNNGKAIAYVSGGTTPLTYLWDNGEINTLAHYLTAGYRMFTLTDNRGCEVIDSIFIPESPEIISTLVIDSTVNCYGDTNAIVSVSTIGGYAQYTYTWSHNPSVTSTGIVDTAFNLSYGSYAVTTEDSLGCYVTDSVYLSEPNLLTVQAIELSWISCKDSADGVAEVIVQGGTMPYHYSWDGGSYITNSIISTLGPGLHSVDVMDAKGCMASTTVFINEPPQLVVSITENLSVYCDGMSTGSLTSQAAGGTPGYTYLWDDNQNLPQTTATAVNLEVGSYTVTVTDSRGCIAHVQEMVVLDPTMELDTVLSHVSCYGLADGNASVLAVGGHAPYSYYWTGPNYSNTVSSIDHLVAGTYTITVVDTNNCVRVSSVDIVEPFPITYNIIGSTVNEHCSGYCDGRIYIDSLLGGTIPYQAVLHDNVTGAVLSPLSIIGDTIMGVCAGDYTVMITDNEGCMSSLIPSGNNHVVVSATYDAPTPVIIPATIIDCYGDSTGVLSLDPVTYDPNYTYTWSNGASGTSVNNLIAGDYYVIAQYQLIGGLSPVIYNGGPIDTLIGNGGYFNGNRHLELNCTNPVRLVSAVVYAGSVETITFELRDNNGVVLDDTTITVQVGEQRLYFDFDIPLGTDLQLGVASNGSNLYRNQNGASFPYNIGSSVSITGTNASSGYYYFFYDIEIEEPGSIVVSECSDTSQITVLYQENQITATSQVDSVDCYGNSTGDISHIISGGVSPYTHLWSNGSTTSIISNVTAGSYTDTVWDANGCQVIFTDVVGEPDDLTVDINRSSMNCNTNYYVLESDVDGGTPPYSYTWSNCIANCTSPTYDVIDYGTYSLTVMDANGCESTSSNITYVESWNCVNDVCEDPCNGSGTYSSLAQCEATCGAPTSIIDGTEKGISIYPNPFHQETTVDFGKAVKYGELKLFDVLGKLIEEYELIDVDYFVIERKDKIDGVYFIEIEIENEKWFEKLIID
jgi:hypothetical protein